MIQARSVDGDSPVISANNQINIMDIMLLARIEEVILSNGAKQKDKKSSIIPT